MKKEEKEKKKDSICYFSFLPDKRFLQFEYLDPSILNFE